MSLLHHSLYLRFQMYYKKAHFHFLFRYYSKATPQVTGQRMEKSRRYDFANDPSFLFSTWADNLHLRLC